jgi:hypothetical protein
MVGEEGKVIREKVLNFLNLLPHLSLVKTSSPGKDAPQGQALAAYPSRKLASSAAAPGKEKNDNRGNNNKRHPTHLFHPLGNLQITI